MTGLILDTSTLLAALDAGEPRHDACAAAIGRSDADLVLPMLVLAELEYWCSKRGGTEGWLLFLDDVLAGAYRLESPTDVDLLRVRELQVEYADLGLGVVDASIVALAERLGLTHIATLDHRHFSVVRPAHTPAFDLVP